MVLVILYKYTYIEVHPQRFYGLVYVVKKICRPPKRLKSKFLRMEHQILQDLATIYPFRSCHLSFALYIPLTLSCLQGFCYIPVCFTLLCLCIPIAWKYPLNPSNSTFKNLFRHQLSGDNFSVLPQSSLS